MAPLIILALLALPFIEIAVFIKVGELIGVWPTVALALLGSGAGVIVVRAAGFAMLGRARVAVARNEPPVDELLDGLCILLAGILLIVPGFVTDVLGLLLLLPWIRRHVRRRIWGMFEARERRVHGAVIEGEYTIVETEVRGETKPPTRRLDKSGKP
jgi:UPF0716 protein FxsA